MSCKMVFHEVQFQKPKKKILEIVIHWQTNYKNTETDKVTKLRCRNKGKLIFPIKNTKTQGISFLENFIRPNFRNNL